MIYIYLYFIVGFIFGYFNKDYGLGGILISFFVWPLIVASYIADLFLESDR